ncbi:MAG TPA: HDOD domain-containing protein [Polyangiaceae bacterium]|nr:HDOD domain-containing protein [Polyangiaceae bacterium]
MIQAHLWYADDHPAHSNELAAHRWAGAVLLSSQIRPFPVVAGQVLSLLGHEDYRTADFEGVILKDPALSATFLRIANSALYRTLVPCESVLMACARLGRNTVREIVVGVATMDMFRDVKSRGAAIRNHCTGTAAIARTLADQWRLRSGDQLFLTGLLHDIGKLLCIQAGMESYDGLPPAALDSPDRLHLVERDRLGYDQAMLGAHVLSSWKIPEPIAHIVAWHHQPSALMRAAGPSACRSPWSG